ncbi:hypothetical protein KI387_002506, partial [Taxus chinensis]
RAWRSRLVHVSLSSLSRAFGISCAVRAVTFLSLLCVRRREEGGEEPACVKKKRCLLVQLPVNA